MTAPLATQRNLVWPTREISVSGLPTQPATARYAGAGSVRLCTGDAGPAPRGNHDGCGTLLLYATQWVRSGSKKST